MVSLYWSWIFIIIFSFLQPGYAHVTGYEVLAQRAVENVFIRNLSRAEKSRNTFVALAISASVVLIVFVLGLVLFFMRRRRKVPNPEAGAAAEKPHWFMVDGKKADWWRLSHHLPGSAKPDNSSSQSNDGSKIERIKAALNKNNAKNGKPLLPMHRERGMPSPRDTFALPIQAIPDVQPQYPDILERGSRTAVPPLYPVQSPPQIPSLTRTEYDGDKAHPRSPPRALVTNGLQRNTSRSSDRRQLPRSPAANRRKSWLARGGQIRNPFLPADAALVAPVSAPAHKLEYSVSIKEPRAAPKPPSSAHSEIPPVSTRPPVRQPPAPLPLTPVGSVMRQARLGLPGSPRGLPGSPRPRLLPGSPSF